MPVLSYVRSRCSVDLLIDVPNAPNRNEQWLAVRRRHPCPIRGIEAKKKEKKEKKEEDAGGSWREDPLLEGVGTYIYTTCTAHQTRIRPPTIAYHRPHILWYVRRWIGWQEAFYASPLERYLYCIARKKSCAGAGFDTLLISPTTEVYIPLRSNCSPHPH